MPISHRVKSSLGSKIAVGAFWMVALRFSIKGVGLISTVILARLLTPEDFGLVAIAMSFFALVELISNFGFDTVIIQKQNATRVHYDTAWSFNATFGIIACLVTIALSNAISAFYANDKLYPMLVVLSFIFLINGVKNIGIVDFRKNLTFNKEFKLQIIPKIISFFCTLGLAVWLRNYWALVIGTLVWKGLITITSYIMSEYRPKLTYAAWRDLFNFSKWLMVNNFLYFANTRSPELLIGKLLSPQAAGFFSIAQEISMLPTTELAANVNSAAYPGYSRLSNQAEKLKAMYLGVMGSISFIAFPAAIGLASIAGIVVPVVLGPQWLETVGLIHYLAIGGLLLALNSNTGYVFLALGRPRISSMMGLFRVAIFIPTLIYLSSNYGLEGAAQAVLLTTMLMFVVSNLLIFFKLKVSIVQILGIHYRPLISSLFMWASVQAAQSSLNEVGFGTGVMALLSCFILGALVYSLCVLLLWNLAGRPEGPEMSVVSFIRKKIFIKPAPL